MFWNVANVNKKNNTSAIHITYEYLLLFILNILIFQISKYGFWISIPDACVSINCISYKL